MSASVSTHPAASPALSPDIGPPLQVMVIEDSRLIRERLLDLISTCQGFEVSAEAETEAEALAALRDRRFDAVVVDLQLREGNGFGVLAALRGRSPRPLTMVLTNTSTRPIRERCLALGAHHFFDKSNEFDRVAQALEALRGDPARG
ncbi:response regulator [Aquabacterium sp. A7-Y]|uniref:response regulator n=1 Tax=Aquabacterium sp. A7-Y TaxID=1349605 RepID=UPI00223E89FC|nr:response regulator [Aquabacterium sp. A7-Y]MCW7536659.1 response regulator [Aquabacterium sp. A7-Y]